uniref:Ubiquitin-conjugating enzyme E2 n=1 Tax=Trepomonas sp. PC1 TaxID=1076344 RepID=A0A146KM78_9EUKA|eukprot:JAP96431.1 Ubiquitin-conjugating enzyme E2 [Trepomonas sp. PC1]
MSTREQALAQQFRLSAKSTDYKVFIPDKQKSYIWHISYKGPKDSEFEGGIYHAIVNLEHYPMKAPSVAVSTPSGAYSPNVPLCLVGITHYHQEGWSQGTSIEGIINAVSAYMLPSSRLSNGYGMISSTPDVYKQLAIESKKWKCECGCDHSKLFMDKKPGVEQKVEAVQQVQQKVVPIKKFEIDFDD